MILWNHKSAHKAPKKVKTVQTGIYDRFGAEWEKTSRTSIDLPLAYYLCRCESIVLRALYAGAIARSAHAKRFGSLELASSWEIMAWLQFRHCPCHSRDILQLTPARVFLSLAGHLQLRHRAPRGKVHLYISTLSSKSRRVLAFSCGVRSRNAANERFKYDVPQPEPTIGRASHELHVTL